MTYVYATTTPRMCFCVSWVMRIPSFAWKTLDTKSGLSFENSPGRRFVWISDQFGLAVIVMKSATR
eukprot:5841490-Pyramimonas_sp.AAC.3